MNVLGKIADLTPAAGFILLVFLIAYHTILLKKKGVKVSSASAFSGKSILLYLFFAFFLFVFLSGIFTPVYNFSLLPKALSNFVLDSVFVRITGAVMIFFSVLLMKATLNSFNVSLRFGLNKNNTGNLVTTGVFAHSRNPFFLSLLFYFAGTALTFPNIFFLAFALAAFTGIHFSILKEEKFLLKVYGDDYQNYLAKVRRYF